MTSDDIRTTDAALEKKYEDNLHVDYTIPTYEQQVAALAHRVTWITSEEFDRQVEALAEANGLTPFAVESDALRHMGSDV